LRNLFFIFFFISIYSCTSEKSVPNEIQQEDIPLINQIADLYFMDLWLSRIKPSDKDSTRIELSEQFSQLHGLEIEELRSSLKNLESEPKRYGLIMDSVISILKSIESKEKGKK